MNAHSSRSHMRQLAEADEEYQRRIIWAMPPAELLKLDADFESWAHNNPLPPNGEGWRVWLMMAGRGFGKTRAGSEWIHRLASGKPGARIALVGATIHEARWSC
jgi:phage terminase large subunit-like protein